MTNKVKVKNITTRGFLIGMWSITLLLDYPPVVLLFLEGAWSNTFDFFFRWPFIRCPLWTTWGSGASVAPLFPCRSQLLSLGASLGFPVLDSVSFTGFGFFVGCSAPSFLSFLRHASWVYSGRSLAQLLNSLLLGACIFSGRYQWPHELLGTSLLVWYRVIS